MDINALLVLLHCLVDDREGAELAAIMGTNLDKS